MTSPSAGTPGLAEFAAAAVFGADSGAGRLLPNGALSRRIVAGAVATGERVRVHESTQPVGAEPNPAHGIDHSELILVTQGTLRFEHDDVVETAAAGDLVYVAYGTVHLLRNVGDVPLRYTVISVGGDV